MKKSYPLGIVTLLLILTTGCGGGGGSDKTTPEPAATSSSTTAPVETASAVDPAAGEIAAEPGPVESTADLTASETFAFTSFSKLKVDIALADYEGVPAYLTICREFSEDQGLVQIDYGSCLLQTPLTDGRYQGSLSVTNDVNELIVAVWRFDGSEPQTHIWSRTSTGDAISI